MKRLVATAFISLTFASLIFGQTDDKTHTEAKAVQPMARPTPAADYQQATSANTMVSAPTTLPAFQLNDSLTDKQIKQPRQLITRQPFFVNEQFSVALGKSHANFKYENITSIGTSFLIRPMSKLSFEVSPVISHYFFGNKQISPFTDFSCTFDAQYDLSEKIAVKAFGQVSSSSANKFYGYTPFVPQNAYGVGVKYKVNKNIGFEVSVERSQYNGMWYHEHNGTNSNY